MIVVGTIIKNITHLTTATRNARLRNKAHAPRALHIALTLVASVTQNQKNIQKMHELLFEFISKYVELTEEEKSAIVSLGIFRSIRKGTTLLKEGEQCNEVYFVLKGCIRIFYIIDGEEKTTAFYTEMEDMTPHCVINKAPSQYYISCVEDSIVTVSNPEIEVEIFSEFPKFESLCRVLSEELLAKQQINFDEFKTSSPEQRYLNLLQKRPDLIQRVPLHQLASYLGMKPESLSRIRKRLLQRSTS